MRNRSAFTLIELLIVVAIIAILAAIAVPNFLEAQVRAKTSRVKNDQRTLALGLESYYVDYSTYPPNNDGITGGTPSQLTANSTDPGVLPAISTPVAYVTSALIEDPFGNRYSDVRVFISYVNSSRDDSLARLVTETLAPLLAPEISGSPLTVEQQDSLYDQGFFLTSSGPDRTRRQSQIAQLGLSQASGNPSDPDGFDFGYLVVEVANNPTIYDPSNGTVSVGDILRTRKGVFTPFLAGVSGL